VSTRKQKLLNFKVRGEEPVQAVPALYSNFLAVSRVGSDVQFEFVFLDLNKVAVLMEEMKTAENPQVPELQGKTVSKVVMPAANVLQLKEHFETIFRALEEIVQKQPEVKHGRRPSMG
jgi:hypothetical protein